MLAPSYRLINPQANRSFVFKWEPFDLTTRWHYHPELEMILFVSGKTTGVIGDVFKEFEEGDLVILGTNFPHVLQENKGFARQFPDVQPFGLIIQFTENFLGNEFFYLPEMQSVRQLLDRTKRGIRFKKPVGGQVIEKLLDMPQQPDTQKLLTLIEVLTQLAESSGTEYMTDHDYYFDYSRDEERMRKVNEYVYKCFAEKIRIADVAAVANMTETAFCRYFKARTLKNFTRFLNEIRVAYACKLLQNPNYSATDACFESGFNHLSYFNRTFKEIVKLTPRDYQRQKMSSA